MKRKHNMVIVIVMIMSIMMMKKNVLQLAVSRARNANVVISRGMRTTC